MADICILVNAASGSAEENRVQRLEDAARPWAGRVEVRPLDRSADIGAESRKAADEGFAVVAAAGGDGTINAVAAGLRDTGARLGVVAMGTFNYVARTLGLPETPEKAVAVLAEGREGRLTIGEVDGRVFLNNASIGVYPDILREREQVYRRFGRSQLAAHWSVLKTLMSHRAPMRLRIAIDGETAQFRSPLLFVANNAFQLELFSLEGAGHVEEGRFAIYAVPDASRWRLIGLSARLALGRLRPREHFTLYAGSEIVVESDKRSHTLAYDGERARHHTPLTFRVHRDALGIMLPREGGA